MLILFLAVAVVAFLVLAGQSPTGNRVKLFTYNYTF